MKGLVDALKMVKGTLPPTPARSSEDLVFDGEENLTLAQIAKKHGLKYMTVYQRYIRSGLTGSDLVFSGKRQRDFPLKVWDGEENLTMPKIAEKHGLAYSTVYARHARNGLTGADLVASEIRPRGRQFSGVKVWDGEEHLTLTAAAEKHGVSREALYYRHKHLGLSGEQLIKGFRAARKPKKYSAQEHAA